MKLEVGQRIDIYKVLNSGGYADGTFNAGEFLPSDSQSDNLAMLPSRKMYNTCLAVPITDNNKQINELHKNLTPCARKVGTMIITKLK